MNGFESWANLGGMGVIAVAFAWLLKNTLENQKRMAESHAEDKRRFSDIVQNHLNHNSEVLTQQMGAMQSLTASVDRVVESTRKCAEKRP